MSITIKDIANRAGVSVTTASRALNKKADVAKATRLRVLAAAQELNYVVNLHARALTGASSKTLGFILYDSSTAFHAAMARGVEEIATARGYSIITFNTEGSPQAELNAHKMLREKRVDGVLVNSIQSGVAPLQRLRDEGTPFVLLNRRLGGIDADYVTVDYHRGSYIATTHLLKLGHSRILVQVAAHDHPPADERVSGYRHALEEHGLPFDEDLVVHTTTALETGYHGILRAMSRLRPRPTAMIIYNDRWAIPALKALQELGLRVPQDVAVIGHNDVSYAPYLSPALTSVSYPVDALGRKGAEILFEKIDWPEDEPWSHRHLVLEPRLVVRASCGAKTPVVTELSGGAITHAAATAESQRTRANP